MPFTSVTELPPDPDVRIFFSGLLILDPNPDPNPEPGVNTCEVFVHRSAPDHHLSIEVRRKRAGRPDIVMMRHLGPLAFIQPAAGVTPRFGMTIRVGDGPQGVRRYDPAGPQDASPEGEGLGYAIDLEGPQFHNGSVGPVSTQGGRPSILFNDAVFYTAARTRDDLNVSLERNGAVVVPRLDPFASVIGANVYLGADDENGVVVSWVQQGLHQTLQLLKQQGVSYEIYVVNEPLYEPDEPQLPRHDEFTEYYKILPGVSTADRFQMQVPEPDEDPETPDPDRGSTTTPCMPVIKGGS